LKDGTLTGRKAGYKAGRFMSGTGKEYGYGLTSLWIPMSTLKMMVWRGGMMEAHNNPHQSSGGVGRDIGIGIDVYDDEHMIERHVAPQDQLGTFCDFIYMLVIKFEHLLFLFILLWTLSLLLYPHYIQTTT
jgi:hypothetical protein